MVEDILGVDNIVKRYGNLTVLDKVSFKVYKGEIFGLLGPNGAGKTTLFRILSGISNPDDGKVTVFRKDPRNPKIRELIGYCPQDSVAYENLTGIENLLFYLGLYNISGREAKETAYKILEIVRLYEYKDKKVKKYSGGMKKRLNLAIALVGNPSLLILDEPTTGMDPNIRREVWNIIKNIKKEGRTILLATHYMEEAEELCDRVAIINKGRIIDIGKPDELKKKAGLKTILTLEIHENIEKAYKIVKEKFKPKIIVAEDNIIKLSIEEASEEPPKILEYLLKNGFKVMMMKVSPPTLEDVFIKYTGERLNIDEG